jgi:hypothetical protein
MKDKRLTVVIFIFIVGCQYVAAQDIVSAWFPSHAGDSWIYEREELDGGNGGGMANPDRGSWRSEETIVSSVTIPEGVLVLKRTRALEPVPAGLARRMPRIKEVLESYYLIRGNCMYGGEWESIAENNQLRTKYRDELLRGEIPPDFCFPLTKGMTWGARPPEVDGVWRVIGINADPFGLNTGTTFHFSARAGSGTMVDRWFHQGIGVLQEISEHHGTYEESRRRLLSAVIDGQAHSYQLKPARTVPLNSWDCDGAGWQHFVRLDGNLFKDHAACVSYAPR